MKNYKEAKEMILSGHNLRETAKALDISYETLRRTAAKEKWRDRKSTPVFSEIILAGKVAILEALEEIEKVPFEQKGKYLLDLSDAIVNVIEAERRAERGKND